MFISNIRTMKATLKFHLLKATFLLSNLFFFILATLVWGNSQKALGSMQLKTGIATTELNEACQEIKLEEVNQCKSNPE